MLSLSPSNMKLYTVSIFKRTLESMPDDNDYITGPTSFFFLFLVREKWVVRAFCMLFFMNKKGIILPVSWFP